MTSFDNNDREIRNTVVLNNNNVGGKLNVICKYATYCKYFQATAKTCLNDEQASSYCGAYDLFDNFIIIKKDASANRYADNR